MMVLVVGGSGSGKSAYAEQCLARLSAGRKKYYLATMQVFDREGREKVERHRKLRAGKGFLTIEQPASICRALEKMEAGSAALLECMSNLTANEMFSEDPPRHWEAVTDQIVRETGLLNRGLESLVIVTNNVFEDGILYDDTTMEYRKALGSVNERLAAMADRVVEVVVGIPLIVKERN